MTGQPAAAVSGCERQANALHNTDELVNGPTNAAESVPEDVVLSDGQDYAKHKAMANR